MRVWVFSCCRERRCSYFNIREQYAKSKIFLKAPFISPNWSHHILPRWLLYLNVYCGSSLKRAKYQYINRRRSNPPKATTSFKGVQYSCPKEWFQEQNHKHCNQPVLPEMIYQELVLDSFTASYPNNVQRIRAMFLGAKGLVADLRHLNPRRTGNKYSMFFTHMETLIEESLDATDDRRHCASHVSVSVYQWFD